MSATTSCSSAFANSRDLTAGGGCCRGERAQVSGLSLIGTPHAFEITKAPRGLVVRVEFADDAMAEAFEREFAR